MKYGKILSLLLAALLTIGPCVSCSSDQTKSDSQDTIDQEEEQNDTPAEESGTEEAETESSAETDETDETEPETAETTAPETENPPAETVLDENDTAIEAAANGETTAKIHPKKDKDIQIQSYLGHTAENAFKDLVTKNSAAYSFCLTDTRANDLRIIKTFDVEPDTVYIISADVKTENVVNEQDPNSPIGVTISTAGAGSTSKGILGTNDWQTVKTAARSNEDGTLEVSLNLGFTANCCSGTAWFDNITVTPATDFKAPDNTWRFLAVILSDTGINTKDADTGKRVKANHTMSEEELEVLKQSFADCEEQFNADAEGLFTVDYDVVVCDTKFTDYTKNDVDSYTMNNTTAYHFLKDNGIDIEGYDHVTVITCLPGLPVNYYGLGGSMIEGAVGYSFIIHTDSQYMIHYLRGEYEDTWPVAAYVHEFLHSIETYSSALGFEMPLIHNYQDYHYSEEEEHRAFYRDLIHNRIEYNGELVGVDPIVWALKPSLFN